jgi:hypothetical protein
MDDSLKLPKIGLGFTLLQQVDSFVMMRWVELLRSHYWPGPVLNGRAQYTVQARNIVVDDFMQRDQYPLPADDWEPGELEALLFWDSDQLPAYVIPQRDGSIKVLTRHLQDLLVENPDKEVIAGLYFSRETEFLRDANGNVAEFPHSPVAYERVEDPRHGYAYRYLSHERMTQEILTLDGRYRLHQVGGVGTGAMLIRKSLLQRMTLARDGKPCFEAPPTDDGRQWTEDLWFCDQVQRLDPAASIWLDSANESAHQGDRIWIRSQHYLAAHGQVGLRSDSAMALEKAAAGAVSHARGRIILPN